MITIPETVESTSPTPREPPPIRVICVSFIPTFSSQPSQRLTFNAMSGSAPPSNVTEEHRAPAGAPLKLHPWSLGYVRLRLSAAVIRTVLGSAMFLAEKIFQGVPKDVEVTKTTLPSREEGRSINVHIYAPKDLDTSKPAAVHLNWHGSGFMIPCLGSDLEFCGKMASQLNMVVLDCDYRKAPEHPWPAAIQDVEDALLWALGQPQRFDLSRVSMGGFSAGANLALCVSTLHGHAVRSVAVFYPPCNFSINRENRKPPLEKHAHAIPLSVAKMFDASYILSTVDVDRKHPLISPIYADPKTFPPVVWLCCARGDTLYHDGKKLMDNLKSAGHSDVEFHDVLGEAHAFDKVNRAGSPTAQKTNDAYKAAYEAIERSWKASSPSSGLTTSRL